MVEPVTGATPEQLEINTPTLALPDELLIYGTPSADVLIGDSRTSQVSGFGGNDRLNGLGGIDILLGGDGNDLIFGGSGNDRMSGEGGNDLLRGDSGHDYITGGEGKDNLVGGSERDFLQGGSGRDRLVGGQGSDVFKLDPGKGTDIVADFKDGTDRLGLNFVELSFDDLEISQVKQNTAIGDGENLLALLVDVDASSITASDFGQVVFLI